MQKLIAFISKATKPPHHQTELTTLSPTTHNWPLAKVVPTQDTQNDDTRPTYRIGSHRLSEIQKTIDLSG